MYAAPMWMKLSGCFDQQREQRLGVNLIKLLCTHLGAK